MSHNGLYASNKWYLFEVNQLSHSVLSSNSSFTFWHTCWVVLKLCDKLPSNSSIWNNWSHAGASSPSSLLTLFLQDPPVSSPIEQTILTYKFMNDFNLPLFKMAAIFRWNKIFIIKCVWFMSSYSTNPLIHSKKHHLTHHFPTLLNLLIILYTFPIIVAPKQKDWKMEGLEDVRFERLGKCASFILLSSVLKN